MAVYFLYQRLGFTYSLIFSISVIGMIFLAFSIAIFSRHIHTDIMNAQNGVYSYTIERLAMPLDIRINSAHAKERVLRQEILNRPLKPFLISVIPATSQILVPEGNGIIASVPVSAESGAFC